MTKSNSIDKRQWLTTTTTDDDKQQWPNMMTNNNNRRRQTAMTTEDDKRRWQTTMTTEDDKQQWQVTSDRFKRPFPAKSYVNPRTACTRQCTRRLGLELFARDRISTCASLRVSGIGHVRICACLHLRIIRRTIAPTAKVTGKSNRCNSVSLPFFFL